LTVASGAHHHDAAADNKVSRCRNSTSKRSSGSFFKHIHNEMETGCTSATLSQVLFRRVNYQRSTSFLTSEMTRRFRLNLQLNLGLIPTVWNQI